MKMNWGFSPETVASAVKVQPAPISSPLRLTYHQNHHEQEASARSTLAIKAIKDTRKTVFHRDEKRDKTSARTSKINLEDFVDRDNVTVQPIFEELSMELKLNEIADQSQTQNAYNYRRALENVKRALPNLRVIRFSGQHYYYPVNGTSDKLRKELHLISNTVQTITQEMRRLNIGGDREEALRYDLYLVFDRKNIDQHQFVRYVSEVFGGGGSTTRGARISDLQLSRELVSKTVRLNANGMECQLNFHFFTELQMLHDLQGFLVHDRMGGSEALSRMLALTLELKLANEKFENKHLKFF